MMTEQEHKELREMHDCVKQSCMMSFDPEYMDHYARLLAKSLEGKGDSIIKHEL